VIYNYNFNLSKSKGLIMAMRSRFLNELTTPEVEKYLSQGGDIALLPVGSVEMHGPHQPIGTDTMIVKAFALKLAEAANALILPEIDYTWAGATEGFAGTVSVEPELVQKLTESIAVKVLKMGFKRIVFLNFHGPNNQVLYLTTRRFFEKYQPVLLLDIAHPFSDEARAIFPRERETSLLLAALEILGQPDLYPEKEIIYEDPAPPFNESYNNLKKAGVVGFYYQDTRHHAPPHLNVSKQKGLDFIDLQVKSLLPVLEDLSKYIGDVKTQKNQGWWQV
jgi:creatinine amidohydrolase